MGYIANEDDISTTVRDFETLCSYVMENKPLLTAKGDLCNKACFELNGMMAYPEANAKESDRMNRYPSISLYFMAAMKANLLSRCPAKGQKNIAECSKTYALFQQMNNYTKYLFVFLAWMRYADLEALYSQDKLATMISPTAIDKAFMYIGKMDRAATISRNPKHSAFSRDSDTFQILLSGYLSVLNNLRDFGIIKYDPRDTMRLNTYQTVLGKALVTDFGISLSAACSVHEFTSVNLYEHADFYGYDDDDDEDEDDEDEDEDEEDEEEEDVDEDEEDGNRPGSIGFFEPFIACFPEKAIDADAINRLLFPQTEFDPSKDNTAYEFKVQLGRGCYRVIQCAGGHTFSDLHLAIQYAFEFDNDHLYAFYLDGKIRSRNSINSPYCEEPPFANSVHIAEARLWENQNILYLFDFGDHWSFQVRVVSIGESSAELERPQIIKSVGKPPEQYPNYEGDWGED